MKPKPKLMRRNRGINGWVVDYETLEKIAAKASQIESVGLEEAEAVILALVDDHFVRLEGE